MRKHGDHFVRGQSESARQFIQGFAFLDSNEDIVDTNPIGLHDARAFERMINQFMKTRKGHNPRRSGGSVAAPQDWGSGNSRTRVRTTV